MTDEGHSPDKDAGAQKETDKIKNPVNTRHRDTETETKMEVWEEETVERGCYGLASVFTTSADVNDSGTVCAQRGEQILSLSLCRVLRWIENVFIIITVCNMERCSMLLKYFRAVTNYIIELSV